MRVLIVGSGGREHTLAWKISQSPELEKLYVAPGNGGTQEWNVSIADNDIASLVAFAKEKDIDLVVPGPELPLTLGIVDAMTDIGIPCFGPSKACAQLEASKTFSKSIMDAAKVPTAMYGTFNKLSDARNFIKENTLPLVIKADGLAAGKGVVIVHTRDEAFQTAEEMLEGGRFGAAGSTILIEEFLQGEELSLICFCDGERALALPTSQDHKAVGEGDTGANTGGMGAYSPAPLVPDSELEHMAQISVYPILKELARRGTPFKGILYAGLMITEKGPMVLEYNVRFGDPECQPLLSRLNNDIIPIMQACIAGNLHTIDLDINPQSAVGVVLTAKGYPDSYPRGMRIKGIEKAESVGQVKVFQAGTKEEGGETLANGGRVLCVTALGDTLQEAKDRAYEALAHIKMDDSYYRTDISDKGIKRLKEMARK